MKFFRYAATIVVTATVAWFLAVAIIGAPDAIAQPADGSGSSATPAVSPAAPPVVTQDKQAPVQSGSAAPTQSPPAAGSAAPAAGSAAPAVTWFEALANRPIDEDGNFWMPRAVNKEADSTDQMFYAVWGLSAFFLIGITIAVVYLVVKYRHRPGHKAEPSPAHHDALEITWTIIPTIISVFLFYYGWRTYINVVTPPTKAIEINVTAARWSWNFVHQNGASDSDLHVPAGVPVRLVMTSTDVLHAFYAPAMRVKQDIIPRRYTYVWFNATKPGTYRLTCAEYCGRDHSQMSCLNIDKKTGACLRRAVVVVHKDLATYERYLSEKNVSGDPEVVGANIFKKTCQQCHSTTPGEVKVGPSWGKTFGTDVKLTDGSTVKMDETYIRESISNPNAKARPGFPIGQMQSYEGQLKEKEIAGIIEYIKSLK
ncbi:MAG TPA: cytochrome c oxidase subunit II [Kofleriaceae bacterium]